MHSSTKGTVVLLALLTVSIWALAGWVLVTNDQNDTTAQQHPFSLAMRQPKEVVAPVHPRKTKPLKTLVPGNDTDSISIDELLAELDKNMD